MYATLILALLSGIWWMRAIHQPDYQLRVIELGDEAGYGYKIEYGAQTVVYQPFVPVLSQHIAFTNAEEAERVGRLVLERLKAGQDFSVTAADLDRLGIGKR